MSFRQNKELSRKWGAFYAAQKDLIEAIGLTGPTVATWDRFADLLMHGIIDHHDDPTHFNIDELRPEQLKLFRVLVDRYFEAGLPNPGLDNALVGGRRAVLKMVRKYPQSFNEYYQKDAALLPSTVSEEWWLDASALPQRLLWARLSAYSDGTADVLDLDGRNHEFGSREEAVHWLYEDEYFPMSDLREEGELPAETVAPHASSDAELVLQMAAGVDA
jgi:hypothetical protein